MKRKLARALRRLADKLQRPVPVYPRVDQTVVAINKATDALREQAALMKKQHDQPNVLQALSIGILGPQIVRSVNDTRGMGVPDSEILDALVERLTDGWF